MHHNEYYSYTEKDKNHFARANLKIQKFFVLILLIKSSGPKRSDKNTYENVVETGTKVIYEKPIAVPTLIQNTITEGNGRGQYGATERRRIRNYSIVARGAAFNASLFHRHRRFVERAEEAAHP